MIQSLLNAGGVQPEVAHDIGQAIGKPVEKEVKKRVRRGASKWNRHVKRAWADYKRKYPKGRKTFAQIVKQAKRSYRP